MLSSSVLPVRDHADGVELSLPTSISKRARTSAYYPKFSVFSLSTSPLVVVAKDICTQQAALAPNSGHLRLERARDIVVSASVLVVLAPLMTVIAGLLVAEGGPVVFRHERVGRGGRKFRCLKFRSMVPNSDQVLASLLQSDPNAREEWDRTQKLVKDPRVTWIGRFLRRSSLDELPQLFNVLAGEMSLVGPRPVVAKELERYGRYAQAYLSVTPGITGLWQISGRNSVSYRRRVALDTAYARKRHFGLDAKIIVGTIPAVIFGKGCS